MRDCFGLLVGTATYPSFTCLWHLFCGTGLVFALGIALTSVPLSLVDFSSPIIREGCLAPCLYSRVLWTSAGALYPLQFETSACLTLVSVALGQGPLCSRSGFLWRIPILRLAIELLLPGQECNAIPSLAPPLGLVPLNPFGCFISPIRPGQHAVARLTLVSVALGQGPSAAWPLTPLFPSPFGLIF